MPSYNINEEDRFALVVTAGVHVVLLAFFILYTFTITPSIRPSFINVQFGEFKSGTLAKKAEVKNEKVATRPDPSETEPEKPKPEKPDPIEKQKTTTKETAKPVDAPDQKEEVQAEAIKTPKTDKVEPKEETNTEEKKDVIIPPKTEKAETQKEGAKTSGDKKGNEGRLDATQGTGNQADKAAPYELKWEGDIERTPMIQTLPQNTTDKEALISVRFEVNPDGSMGRIIPLKKMNPELEREVMRTLRSWRFSRLPSGVPQQSQWGTITFHFVLE